MKLVIVGFTGTRKGMTDSQLAIVTQIIEKIAPTELHHGDCLGADADMHYIATTKKIPVVVHPPWDSKHRAHCKADTVLPQKTYADRNREIVLASQVVIATPREHLEPNSQRAGGTWMTIRCARTLGKRVLIVWPNGRLSMEDHTE